MVEIYEETYQNKKHFSFGKNWQNFLKTLNEERIEQAKKSLIDFLGGAERIKGKTFVDIGCGSGLFSLAAYLLGAKEVVSIDVDEFSISCTAHLRENKNNPDNWKITKGSALDGEFMKSLGKFDIVYSWGVLHHTGKMYEALGNTAGLLDSRGYFYLAIYNKNEKRILEGTSRFWLKVKKIYNSSSFFVKKLMEIVYVSYCIVGLAVHFINPFKYIKNYVSLRGMSFYTDIKDWLGGYPYEFATVDEMKDFFKNYKLTCPRYKKARSIGCNEFLFIKNSD